MSVFFFSLTKQQQIRDCNGAALPVLQGPVGDRVWHCNDEFVFGSASPKAASAASLEQGEGAASSGGFVALNLSSGRQDADSREWVMVERPNGSPGAKVCTSPSEDEDEEEPEVLQPQDSAPGWDKGSPTPGKSN